MTRPDNRFSQDANRNWPDSHTPRTDRPVRFYWEWDAYPSVGTVAIGPDEVTPAMRDELTPTTPKGE